MSDSIDAISGVGSGANGLHKDAVKESTKKKLEELGIDPTSVKTEAEAQKKIKEAESAQAHMNVHHVPKGNEANPIQQVMEDTKELAEKVGIKVSAVSNIEDLFKVVDRRIKELENEATVDKAEKYTIDPLRQEFDKIYSTYTEAKKNQSTITNNLNILASYNMIRS